MPRLDKKNMISNRLKEIRHRMGRNKKPMSQAKFAALAGVTQTLVSAWENPNHTAVPSSEAYSRIANKAPYPDSIWLREQAGVNTDKLIEDVLLLIKDRTAERTAEPPEGKIVAVPPLSGEGLPWYVDARLVPNPAAVAYRERENRGDTGSREVVILDTSVTELNVLWEKFVLVESTGSLEDDPVLPWRGVHMGRFSLADDPADLDLFTLFFMFPSHPPVALAFQGRPGTDPSKAEQEFGWPLRSHRSGLTKSERQRQMHGVYDSEGAIDLDKLEEYRAWENELHERLRERAERDLRLPNGIIILGQVLTWFRIDQKEGGGVPSPQ